MADRLKSSPSPYLRQHADNPVDWWPWGHEALKEAARRDVPIFLSAGYSSCHWCHVMAHESFEDEGVARVVNAAFVPIKLDREEHPDVDAAYMQAVLMSSGHGGWPMTVFALPTGEPFFAGTYFPREDQGSRIGFRSLCEHVARAWREDRESVERSAESFAQALRAGAASTMGGALDSRLVQNALAALRKDYDPDEGGFGGPPKFPPHSALRLLQTVGGANREMATGTLRSMQRGGIHDHAGGGFHRYATDGEWRLPHFEKTLYDNALLLRLYLRDGPEVAHGIADWLEREMRLEDGTFASALDADSEGEEGVFYTWTRDEVVRAVGQAFADRYDVRPEGNFRDEATGRRTGRNVLFDLEPDAPSPVQELAALRRLRDARVRPGRDEKALVGWNGLTILALAEEGRLEVAERASKAILAVAGEELPRYLAQGQAYGRGYLEDYAGFGLALHAIGWADESRRWLEKARERFADPASGGYFDTDAGHDALFGRTKTWTDQPVPSANALMAEWLLLLGHTDECQAVLEAAAGWMWRAPTATEALHTVLYRFEQEDSPAGVEVTAVPGGYRISIPEGMTVTLPDLGRTLSGIEEVQAEPGLRYQVCRDGVCGLPVTLEA